MGLFGPSSPFDTEVEKATSETNISEQWDVIIDICDKVGSDSKNAKDCIRSIMKRVGHTDPHVAIQAITLLDACIKNCGQKFHLEIASREFENEFRRLMVKAPTAVAQKMRISLKKWADGEFKNDSELNLIPSLYQKMKSEGLDFTDTSSQPVKATPVLSKDPNVVNSQQEEDDIAKAIELSLKDKGDGVKTQTASYSSLYPAMSLSNSNNTGTVPKPQPEARKVRALYDFEAAEDNELTFMSGEIIHVLDDTDPNWWKGYNKRGEGLFPSNFVTADLNAEPESNRYDSKKTVSFAENEQREEPKQETVEIDEGKIDRLLYLLHEANPEDPSQDTEEMFMLEAQVNQMLPLIDCELERVDRNHAKLTQLSSNLVDAINLYHTLMRDSDMQLGSYNLGQIPPHMYRQSGPPQNGMYNVPNNMYSLPPQNYAMPHLGNQYTGPSPMVNTFHPQQQQQQQPQQQQQMALPQFQSGHQNVDSSKYAANPNAIASQQLASLPINQHMQQHITQYPLQQQQFPSEPQHHHSQQIKTEQIASMQSHELQPHSIPNQGFNPNQQLVHPPPLSQPSQNPIQQPSYPSGAMVQPNFQNVPTLNNSHSQQMLNQSPNINHMNPNLNLPPGSSYIPNTVMTSQIQNQSQIHIAGSPAAPISQMPLHLQGQMNLSPMHNHMGMMPNNLAAINQPVTSTILPQSDSRTNIPVFQQQR